MAGAIAAAVTAGVVMERKFRRVREELFAFMVDQVAVTRIVYRLGGQGKSDRNVKAALDSPYIVSLDFPANGLHALRGL